MWKATNQNLICNINQCSKCRCVIALYSCCVPVHCNTSPYNKSSCCNPCVSEANNFYIQDRWLCGHSGAANSRIRASAEPSALLQKLFAPFCFSLSRRVRKQFHNTLYISFIMSISDQLCMCYWALTATNPHAPL